MAGIRIITQPISCRVGRHGVASSSGDVIDGPSLFAQVPPMAEACGRTRALSETASATIEVSAGGHVTSARNVDVLRPEDARSAYDETCRRPSCWSPAQLTPALKLMKDMMNAEPKAGLTARAVTPECVETIELVRDILARVGDKWTVLIITSLAERPARFTTLHERVAGISQRMLSHTLRSLVRDGLITRVAYAEVPPRVEYSLTPLGRSLADAVSDLVGWVQANQAAIIGNRGGFDTRS